MLRLVQAHSEDLQKEREKETQEKRERKSLILKKERKERQQESKKENHGTYLNKMVNQVWVRTLGAIYVIEYVKGICLDRKKSQI